MASEEDTTEITLKFEPEEDIPMEPPTVADAPCPDNEEGFIGDYKLIVKKRFVKKAQDIHEKMIIVKNVLEECKEETKNTQANPLTHMNKLQYYTKQPYNYLNEVLKEAKSTERSLKQVIMDTKPLPSDVIPHIYSDIRDIFIEYYVKNKQMPTMIDFLKSLYNKRDVDFYKSANIRTLVKNNLVKYHHLPNLDRFILTEKPEFAYQRHLYLRQIIGYRSQGKSIVYVTVLNLENSDRKPSFLGIAANPAAGIIAKSDALSYTGDEENGSDEVKFWIRNMLLPRLSSSSVIVLMQQRKKNTTPTPFSTKQQMLDWLHKWNVPADETSHKAQLYNLVKIQKNKRKEHGFYEEILKSAGFNVLICPIEYPSLNFFHDIYSNAKKTLASLIRQMTKLYQEEWTMVEQKIIEEEKQMMKDDEEMEKIIENLFVMVKNGDLRAEDFPEGCRGSKEDNFSVHIGDIIID